MIENIGKVLDALATLFTIIVAPFTAEGRKYLATGLHNLVHGSIDTAGPLIDETAVELGPLIAKLADAIEKNGPKLNKELDKYFGEFATLAFDSVKDKLEKNRDVKPADWEKVAGQAFSDAVKFGLSSFAVTTAFELIFPKQLNSLNSIGPMLATLASFQAITDASIRPMLYAGIGQPARYDANSKFRSLIPDIRTGQLLFSRGKITRDQLESILSFGGLAPEWVDGFERGAYRPVNPRILVQSLLDTPFPRDRVEAILIDNGYNPDDVQTMLQLFEYSSTKNVRQQLISESTRAYEQGVISDDELHQTLTDQGWSDAAISMATSRALIGRRITLAKEVEKQVTAEVSTGGMTPDQGLQNLLAAGVQDWYANLVITLATTRATIHQARLDATAEHRLTLERQRDATAAAVSQFQSGALDEQGFAAALAAAGVDPVAIAALTLRLDALRTGRLKHVFGKLLDPAPAQLLTSRVAAVEAQLKKELILPADATAQLKDLGIADNYIDALLARWAAEIAAPTKHGLKLNPLG